LTLLLGQLLRSMAGPILYRAICPNVLTARGACNVKVEILAFNTAQESGQAREHG